MELAQITGQRSVVLPFEEILVMPIGDVQLGAQGVNVDLLKEKVDWGREHDAYFLGMGDYIDVLSPSNREAWRSARLYDSARQALADQAAMLTNNFADIVAGTKWLGLLEGHHYFEFADGTTSDTRIANALGTTFLGSCAFVRIVFGRDRATLPCTIWCHHGAGNGLTPHSPLTRLYHVMHSFDADIYLMGHQSKMPVVKVPRLHMSAKPPYRIVAREHLIAGTGAFVEGYHQGHKHESGRPQGSYVEKALLSPITLGSPTVKICPVHTAQQDFLKLTAEV